MARDIRADSSRAHVPHGVAAPVRMRETESLRRHAHVPERSRRLCSSYARTAPCRGCFRGAFGSAPGLPGWNEVLGLCYTEKAPNAWQRRGTQKTRNTYNQPNIGIGYWDCVGTHKLHRYEEGKPACATASTRTRGYTLHVPSMRRNMCMHVQDTCERHLFRQIGK